MNTGKMLTTGQKSVILGYNTFRGTHVCVNRHNLTNGEKAIIADNKRVINSLLACFRATVFFNKNYVDFCDNKIKPIDIDIIDRTKRIPVRYKTLDGTYKKDYIYAADFEKMLDTTHRQYWGLFPPELTEFRKKRGEAPSREYDDFIAEADKCLRASKALDVYDYFLSPIEGEIKNSPGLKPFKKVLEDNNVDIRSKFYEALNNENPSQDDTGDICSIECYGQTGGAPHWNFTGIVRHSQDSSIYKVFPHFYRHYALSWITGYDITRYEEGKPLLIPANSAKYKEFLGY
jgi:hypothetical protein